MKKIIFFCVLVTLFFLLAQLCWVSYYSFIKDSKIEYYPRFFASNEEGQERINWWAFLSPIQFESQSIAKDTLYLLPKKIFFPCGKNSAGELRDRYIADEISKYISSWEESIDMNYQLDYDQSSVEVRMNQNPKVRFVGNPKLISLELRASSSAEYCVYGYEKSIQRGKIEKENLDLCMDRLDRAGNILESRGIHVSKKSIFEMQLSDPLIHKAVKDKSILDRDRFVEAKASMEVERIKVETITFPILLPFWILLFSLLFFLIGDLKSLLKENKKAKGMKPEVEKKDWWIIFVGVVVAVFTTIFYKFKNLFKWIFEMIQGFFVITTVFIVITIASIIGWWDIKTTCQKVVITLSFLLVISFILNIYLLFFK